MKKTIVFSAFFSAFFCLSCVNKKYIYQSNTFYEIKQDGSKNELVVYDPDKGFKAIIKEKDDIITIKPIDSKCKIDIESGPKPVGEIVDWRADIVNKKYFPETDLIEDYFSGTSVKIVNKFKYFDTKPVLQTMAIPLKIRPKISENGNDYFVTAESKFDVGLAFGWKFNHNVFNSSKNIFGQNTNRWSLSTGLFLGGSAIDLSAGNTFPKIAVGRKTPGIAYGGFIMLGLNGVNLGYALGADNAFGEFSGDWIYQNKHWHGIILSVDVLK